MASYKFAQKLQKALDFGYSRSLLLSGNISDLFFCDSKKKYLPLPQYLHNSPLASGRIVIRYSINGSLKFTSQDDKERVSALWDRYGESENSACHASCTSGGCSFASALDECTVDVCCALSFLFRLCCYSRQEGDFPDLLIILESPSMMFPAGGISSMSASDRRQAWVFFEWISDLEFQSGRDMVILLAESRSLLYERISSLPQLGEIAVANPGYTDRLDFIVHYYSTLPEQERVTVRSELNDLAFFSAGLSLQALLQALREAGAGEGGADIDDVLRKVDEYIKYKLGAGIVSYRKPRHNLSSVVGYGYLRDFLASEFMPRVADNSLDALAGAAICGPIGSGKRYIFEAVAGELGIMVLVLRKISSVHFSQSSLIFERLRRFLDALPKVMVFIEEADTHFGMGRKGAELKEHRLASKIQALMADESLRGKICWLLMTSRVDRLSPELRRHGRVGDLIIPLLDPKGDDLMNFVRWACAAGLGREVKKFEGEELRPLLHGLSAAGLTALRRELELQVKILKRPLTLDEIRSIIEKRLEPDIGRYRRYQELQALLNCTRKDLLPSPEHALEQRDNWRDELSRLNQEGYV